MGVAFELVVLMFVVSVVDMVGMFFRFMPALLTVVVIMALVVGISMTMMQMFVVLMRFLGTLASSKQHQC